MQTYSEPKAKSLTESRFDRLSKYDGFWNSVIYETEHFVVIPTLGMLVEGWMLVIPRRYMINFGYLTDREKEDYKILTDLLIGFYEDSYNLSPTIFEHGPANEKTPVGCGVDYAHKHFVPLSFSLLEASKKLVPGELKPTKDIDEDLLQAISSKQSFLHICEQGKDFLLMRDVFESQILRKVIADRTSQIDSWDWKSNFFENRIEKSIQTFKAWESNICKYD